MQLKGKTALVTGSTSGIGLAMAKAMAKQGANVMMNGFGDKDASMAEVKAYGVEVDYHGADMSKPAEIAQMIAACEQRFGSIDVLINNAGIQHVANVEDFPVDRWDAVIAINLSSAFHATRLALPGMKQRNWGRIINIASVHGLVASMQRENISNDAAKHALVSEKQPSGEFVKPEQLAALAVFLCGQDASEVRGAAWNMDGGWTAQ